MKYKVLITETLCREVEVEAETKQEAQDKVEEDYGNGTIVLDYEDYSRTDIEVENVHD